MTEGAPYLVLVSTDPLDGLMDRLREDEVVVQVSERSNLDGTVGGWLAVVALTVPAIPAVLREVREFCRRDAVEEITFEGVTIKHPRPQDVDRLLAQFDTDDAE